ncbi:hypothetical protein [Synechococcus sp. CCAP 1479/9]|uniref:hypothetical protein n=1 Tax=Synechococcus sp. CCAP 1479/9 TaxID=1221593 RepID=UPI001C22B5A8|nr:hypothetical protein [Synechococcus sp. CCAP 1479/9]
MTPRQGNSAGDHFRGRYAEQPDREEAPARSAPPSPKPSQQPSPPSAPRELKAKQPPDRAGRILLTIVLALAVCGVAVEVVRRNPRLAEQAPAGAGAGAEALETWQASCGSPPVAGLSWWPVLGPPETLSLVRNRFCGDAFITAEGAVQVASFSSVEEATNFAQELSAISGYAFRVGQSRTP